MDETQEDPFAVKLGSTVRYLRTSAGLTQEQLAERMTGKGSPMRQNTVAKLERAARPTSLAEVHALGSIFGMRASELVRLCESDEVTQADEAQEKALSEVRVTLRGLREQLATATQHIGALQTQITAYEGLERRIMQGGHVVWTMQLPGPVDGVRGDSEDYLAVHGVVGEVIDPDVDVWP